MAVEQAVAQYQALGAAEKTEFKRSVGIPFPQDSGGLTVVWVLLLLILGVVVIGGGWLVYQLIEDDKETAVLVGFVSAALGALIGLIAPSPISGNNSA